MPDFIAPNTLETLTAFTRDLEQATTRLTEALTAMHNSSAQAAFTITPQGFVERVLALDEQISRTRLLLPLSTTDVLVNESGRTLSLSDLLAETRSEFDTLARAQLAWRTISKPVV